MQRVVSSILIALILISQGLAALHPHSGITSGHSASELGRPHFHVHGSHSHGTPNHHAAEHRHNPEPEPAWPTSAIDAFSLHDEDAWYLSDSVVSTAQRSGDANTFNAFLSLPAVTFSGLSDSSGMLALDRHRFSAHQCSSARKLLFLRSVVMRC